METSSSTRVEPLYCEIPRPSSHLYDWSANYTSDSEMFPLPHGKECPKVTLNDMDVSQLEIVRVYTGTNGWIDVIQRDPETKTPLVVEGPSGKFEVQCARTTGKVKIFRRLIKKDLVDGSEGTTQISKTDTESSGERPDSTGNRH